MTRVLQASHLKKAFGERTVVDDVSIQVGPGEIVGLLGPNGAGKTTVFKMILGLEPDDGGEVLYGRNLNRMPLYRRAKEGLGYLPQTPSVFRGLSVRDNVLVLLRTLKKKDPSPKADELLARFGLESLARQKASTLSGGERRRLEFARALCSEPGILLVDEPFAGVDPIAVAEISAAIRDLAADGIGVLLTDHTVRESFQICSRIYLLVDGCIVESGDAATIRQSEKAQKLYLGSGFDSK